MKPQNASRSFFRILFVFLFLSILLSTGMFHEASPVQAQSSTTDGSLPATPVSLESGNEGDQQVTSAYPIQSIGTTAAGLEAPSGTAEAEVTCAYQTNPTFEARVLELINIERAKVGAPALRLQSQLATAARLHSGDMACNNYFSHTGLDGSSVGDRLARQGYVASYWGENIAAGYTTPESVMNGWMNSPGHKANILNVNYTEVGIGYAHWSNSKYGAYWTQDFGKSYTVEISGNAGAPGAVMNYTGGTAFATASGSYTLSVPIGWSGTVTPTHPCYTFSPGSHTYSNVSAGIFGQDFTATSNNSPECKVTVGVFRPSNGVIFLKNANITGYADLSLNYGMGGDYPVVGDWDNNGTDTIGVYRNGTFLLRNSNTAGYANLMFAFGQAGDQPVAGDWDGNGTVTVGVYRPTTGAFYLRNTNSAGAPDISFFLGNAGDVGIAGDWDGDGTDTTGVFRPSNGVIFLKNTNTSGFADVALNYGMGGDKPVVGDWDGNGTTTIGILRGNRFYLRNSNTNGFANITLDLGIPGDMPIAGDWDGKP